MRSENHFKQFVVIDDDRIVHLITKYMIRLVYESVNVLSFQSPELAMNYFNSNFVIFPVRTIILLDICMPEMTGWEVLNKLTSLHPVIKKHFCTFIYSSSIDPKDRIKALAHPMVRGFIEKPLSEKKIRDIWMDAELNIWMPA